ncbi:MAG: AAA family ATPase [Rhodospirillaceae bacterium]|nr:AAA family ATPase [Rhodospirillaceae bacterium]
MIVTIGNMKGGVGKSTLACNVAAVLARAGTDVLLVDGDRQGSSADFIQARAEGRAGAIPCVRAQGREVVTQTRALADKMHHVIIDAGGQDNPSLRAGLAISDCVLVPIVPRSFETWALDGMADLLEEAALANPGLEAFIILNMAPPRGQDTQATAAIIREDYPQLCLLETVIVHRKVFSDAAGQGLSVLEARPRNFQAISELQTLMMGLGLWQSNMEGIYDVSTKTTKTTS